jgi:hypothetical protein
LEQFPVDHERTSRVRLPSFIALDAAAIEAWDMLMFGLRLGADPRVVATTTPKPIKIIRGPDFSFFTLSKRKGLDGSSSYRRMWLVKTLCIMGSLKSYTRNNPPL